MNKRMRILDLCIGLVIGAIVMAIYINVQLQKIKTAPAVFEVKVINEYLNVRKDHSAKSNKIYEILEDEEYKVIEVFDNFEAEPYYVWYKIVFSDRRIGWIANYREEYNEDPWIEIVEK